MAANLAKITTITSVTNGMRLGDTNETTLFGPVPADTVYRVKGVRATNFDGTNNDTITLQIQETGSPTIVSDEASTITVPADAAIQLIKTTDGLELQEGQYLVAQAGTANRISVRWTYHAVS